MKSTYISVEATVIIFNAINMNLSNNEKYIVYIVCRSLKGYREMGERKGNSFTDR